MNKKQKELLEFYVDNYSHDSIKQEEVISTNIVTLAPNIANN